MSLIFTDWENYTDDDGIHQTLDWSSVEAIRNTPIMPRLEALRQAINERTVAQTGQVFISAPFQNGYPLKYSNTLSPDLSTMIHPGAGFIDFSINAFINGNIGSAAPVNTSGQYTFDGLDQIPLHTQSSILAAISPTEQLITLLTTKQLPTAEWLYQKYRMLNLIVSLWKILTNNGMDLIGKKSQRKQTTPGTFSTKTWQQTIDEFNALPFYDSETAASGDIHTSYNLTNPASPPYTYYQIVRKKRWFGVTPPANSPNFKYDVYALFTKCSYTNETYENNDYPSAEEDKQWLESQNNDGVAGVPIYREFGNFSDANISLPIYQYANGYSMPQSYTGIDSSVKIVQHFNVPGGFTFQ